MPIDRSYIDQAERGKSRNECQSSHPRWSPVPPAATTPAPGHGPCGGQAHKPAVRGRGAAQPRCQPRALKDKTRHPCPGVFGVLCLWLFPLPCCFRSACFWFPCLGVFGVLCLWFPCLGVFGVRVFGSPCPGVFGVRVFGSPCLGVFGVRVFGSPCPGVFGVLCLGRFSLLKKLKKIGAASTRWATGDGCPRRARQGRGAVGNPRTRRAVHRLALWAGGLSTAGAVA